MTGRGGGGALAVHRDARHSGPGQPPAAAAAALPAGRGDGRGVAGAAAEGPRGLPCGRYVPGEPPMACVRKSLPPRLRFERPMLEVYEQCDWVMQVTVKAIFTACENYGEIFG